MSDKDESIGWILVHSEVEYGDSMTYATPMDELADCYEPGLLWHWRHHRPPREQGPYTILFAWKGEVFGEGEGDVTHDITEKGFNFAFKLHKYKKRKAVPLARLHLGKRLHHHRSLIRLDSDSIIAAYNKLK